MRDQLIRYIDLLFAGAPDAYEVKQEILQNTLDRYDDLVSQGKSPDAAYRLAISGIGDINEILGGNPQQSALPQNLPVQGKANDSILQKILRAVAIAMYILCPLPLLLLRDEEGLCALLVFVAIATALLIIAGKSHPSQQEQPEYITPKQELRKSINAIIWAIGLCVYFILSFTTHAWYITWVVFLITPAVQGLVTACLDLIKEEQ